MNADSNKRQHLKKQILSKAQIVDISLVEKVANVLNNPRKYDFLERATSIPTNKQIEIERFIICFDYFNLKECQFEQFDPTKGKKLLEIFEQVAKCEISKFPQLKLSRDSVERKGAYESLFSKLSPDVNRLEETELSGGRLFYFITEPRFNIVSVETKHRNIDR